MSLYVSVYMDIKYFSHIGLCEKVWFKSLLQTGWNARFFDIFSIITGIKIWLFLCEMSLNVCVCMNIRYFHLSACARKSEKSRNTFKVKFWLFLWESLYVSVYMDIKYFSPIGLCEKVWFKSLSQTGWNAWFFDTFSIITGISIWLFLCKLSLNACVYMNIKYFLPFGLCEKVWFSSLLQTSWNAWFFDIFYIITGI